MTKCYQVKSKRSICSPDGGYIYNVLDINHKVITLNINSKEMNSFSVDDFIVVEDNKISKVIPNKLRNSYKKSKKTQVKK